MIENRKKNADEPRKPLSQFEEWQVDAGINEVLLENPVNRLTADIPASTKRPEVYKPAKDKEDKSLDISRLDNSVNMLNKITLGSELGGNRKILWMMGNSFLIRDDGAVATCPM
ncbi:MAG: hypothetical protein CMM24_02845 [Rhodospirillaceae bacterium]|nr:hypothetical protein [Rhodospirillaceae bacterium]